MSDSAPGNRTVEALGLLGLSVACAHLIAHVADPAPYDDAFMFVRYAKHALEGLGHAWNPDGVQTYGSTSLLYFLWILLLTATLPVSDTTLIVIGSTIPAVCGAALLMWIVRREARSWAFRAHPFAVAGTLAVVLMGERLFPFHASTGMDTSLAFLSLTALGGAALALGRGAPGALSLTTLLAWVAFAVRPDSGLAAVLVPSLTLLLSREGAARWRELAAFGAGFGALMAADLGLKTWWFGTPVPLPYLAKGSGFYTGYTGFWNPFEYLHDVLVAVGPALAVLLLTLGRAQLPLAVPLLAPVALTWTYYFSVEQIMGFKGRFYIPMIALLLLAAARTLDDRLFRGAWPKALPVRGMGVILALMVPALMVDISVLYGRRQLPALAFDERCYATTSGKTLSKRPALIHLIVDFSARLPAGARFAFTEHGQAGAARPDLVVDDIVALHDTEYATLGFSADRFYARKPDVVWGPHYHYKGLFREVVSDPRWMAEYEWWPEVLGHGIAIRKDSPHRASIEAALRESWLKHYPGLELEDYRAVALYVEACRDLQAPGKSPR